jgi:cyclopropane fatty-acyl-phospholipid synthase-like methyltransferase
MNNRIKDNIIEINSKQIKDFYSGRAKNYNEQFPYVPIMFQDSNPELTLERDKHEKETILPMLELQPNHKVIDIGCGIGRWAEAVLPYCKKYLGIDFCDELIKIAKSRIYCKQNDVEFSVMKFQDVVNNTSSLGITPPFNRVIISGVCTYLNDYELEDCFVKLENIVDIDTIIYIREPVGIESRLTLKQYFSDEMKSYYNAIYRTVAEYHELIDRTFIKYGFEIIEEREMLTNSLRNRNETTQYFFVLKRMVDKI